LFYSHLPSGSVEIDRNGTDMMYRTDDELDPLPFGLEQLFEPLQVELGDIVRFYPDEKRDGARVGDLESVGFGEEV